MINKDGLLRGNPTWLPGGKSPNPLGRPRKLIRRMEEALHVAGKDPILEILTLLEDGSVSKREKLKVWVELLPYLYPKAKEEASAADEIRESLAAMTQEQLVERMEQDLLRLKNSG